ncbi:MAG TPA: sodium-translocating pyrophosphatase, partial [Solirubrobacterales bacterium]|nr:sodium-translocating pyrophosphatase [Solirubrobacterales bacterium]
DQGTKAMQDVASTIYEGAVAFIRRQYVTIGVLAIVASVIVGAVIAAVNTPELTDTKGIYGVQLGLYTAIAFIVGAACSMASGIIGMFISVKSNLRTAAAAQHSLVGAVQVAMRGGAVSGFLVVALSLLGVSVYYWVLTGPMGLQPNDRQVIDSLVSLGFGASLISIFARLGGGIFTQAADVGADLVGKVEAGIPEDDPRNPAVIADNVGDNVGDCAGMAADLFETYAVTSVAVMLLGVLTFNPEYAREVAIYPLVLGGIAIIASIIGALTVRTTSDKVEGALYRGLLISGILSVAAFYPITDWMMSDPLRLGFASAAAKSVSVADLWLCAVIGVAVTALLFGITEFYTATRFRPVKMIAQASETGHATNIIAGLSQGFQSTAAPALVIAGAILAANQLAGIYGIGIAVVAQLSLCGLIVALDAFGPITDNAGGIAEMAELPEEVRNVTDPLDAVGNTTKAVTKGYAIGSAALAALVLFAAFRSELADEAPAGYNLNSLFHLTSPDVLIGLIIGGMMVYLFLALSIEAVGRAGGQVVEQVRKQFKEHPGIMDGTEKPEYGETVSIVTLAAQKEMILPALIPIIVPVIVGILSVDALGGLLIGVIVVGLFQAISMTAGGGAWDNAKKLIEDGAHGGKGSPAHEASVTGDTVGDPYKDTAGPAINPMIKVANIVAILIIPIVHF